MLAARGEHGVPRPDIAIFADTRGEPHWVYRQYAALRKWVAPYGIPLELVSRGDLAHDMTTGWVRIPAFTRGRDGRMAPLRRQCTSEYKIKPIHARIRALIGKPAPMRIPRHAVVEMIGLSRDEVSRMAPAREQWIEKTYPLIDAGIYRSQCHTIVEDAGLPLPRKSACVYCPYHSDAYWRDLKKDPPEFAAAVAVDEAIRHRDRGGTKGPDSQPLYLHRSGRPLAEIDFGDQPDLFDEECAGVCGL